MEQNDTQLSALRKRIYDTLDPLIDANYSLLDVPDHFNIGDQLICEGELAYLRRLPFRMNYMANLSYCDFSQIPKRGLILLHGGGNFGDMWRWHQEFKTRVVASFPESKIVIFPQTVHYNKKELLESDGAIFAKHRNLTICARDERSYALLKKYFSANNILLVPDMAFCLDLGKYREQTVKNKILILKRLDKELNESFDLDSLQLQIDQGKKIEVRDWPPMERNLRTKWKNAVTKLSDAVSKRLVKRPGFKNLVNHSYGMKRRNLSEWYMRKGIDFINQYDEIYTTRLHGYILSILLNKKVNLIDNSYGKNSGFYETWMKTFDNSSLVEA